MGYIFSKLSRSRSPKRRVQPLSSTPPKLMDSGVYVDPDGTTIRILSQQMGGTVRQVGNDYVLKSGDRVNRAEVAAMLLVQKHTSVPVPELIKAQFDEGSGQGHLWMSIVPGCTLAAMWEKLSDNTKRQVCRRVWDLIAQIRGIRQPPASRSSLQCSADGSATHDPLLEDLHHPPASIQSDDVLRARILQRYLHYAGKRYAKELPRMLPRSSNYVFTHADISPRNIMVDCRGRITGIIDWEAAGWYPHYWEYANMMGPANQCGDWQDWMDRTAPPQFKCDLAGIEAARRVLF